MHDQPIPPGDLALDHLERVVLGLLLGDGSPGLWSLRELGVAVGSELAADDAVVGLHAAGLVHRSGEFVFPTRAAVRFEVLVDA